MPLKFQLILGSKSPYRKALLEQAGLSFKVHSAAFDEDQFKQTHAELSPKELCLILAEMKAKAVKETLIPSPSGDFIIGSDQLIEIDTQIIGKPGSFKNAQNQLRTLSGRSHLLHTSLALIHPNGQIFKTVRTTEIFMRTLSPEIIDSYLRLEQPFDCAGSYKMEKAGLLLVKSMNCSDPSAIQGLSLMDVTEAFEHFGYSLKDFWKETQ